MKLTYFLNKKKALNNLSHSVAISVTETTGEIDESKVTRDYKTVPITCVLLVNNPLVRNPVCLNNAMIINDGREKSPKKPEKFFGASTQSYGFSTMSLLFRGLYPSPHSHTVSEIDVPSRRVTTPAKSQQDQHKYAKHTRVLWLLVAVKQQQKLQTR